MTKLIATIAAAAILATSFTAPAFATDEGRPVKPITQNLGKPSPTKLGGKAKLAIGLAIGAGIIGAIAASQARADDHRPSYRDRDGDYGHGAGQCRIWRLDCRDGYDRACRKFDRHC